MKNKKIKIMIVFMVLMLLLASCGKDQNGKGTSGGGQKTDVPIPGGTMNIAIYPREGEMVNPLTPYIREMVDLYSLIYDGLIRYDDEQHPIPALAENWEEGEGELEWIFHLRKGVKFHDGKEMLAADVIYTFDVLKSYKEDAEKKSFYKNVFDHVEEYSQIDEYTIKIKAKKKGMGVLHALVFPIVPEGSTFSKTAFVPGTGCYKVSSFKDEKVHLEANDAGWLSTPYITHIVAHEVKDSDRARSMLRAKQLDVVHTSSITATHERQDGVIDYIQVMTQEFEFIVPNMSNPLLAKKKMRQAIIAAINRKDIVTEAYLTNAISVDAPVAPDTYLFDQEHNIHEYNPGLAKQYFSDLGLKENKQTGYFEYNGQEIKLRIIVNENPALGARADAARIVAKQLKEVGIYAEVKILNWSDYTQALTSSDFDLAFVGASIGRDGNVSFLLHSSGTQNYGKYSSSTLDSILQRCTNATTEQSSKEAFAELQTYAAEELPILSLYFRTNSLLSAHQIKGIHSVRDLEIYRRVSSWYIYVEGDDKRIGEEN